MSNATRTPQQAMADAIKSGAVQAFADGKPVQFNYSNKGWKLFDGISPAFASEEMFWRPAPTPRLRPWTRDEVPPGCVIRLKANHSFWVVLTARLGDGIKCGVMTAAGLPSEFDRIQTHPEDYEYSTDCGKTWAPCAVQEGGE